MYDSLPWCLSSYSSLCLWKQSLPIVKSNCGKNWDDRRSFECSVFCNLTCLDPVSAHTVAWVSVSALSRQHICLRYRPSATWVQIWNCSRDRALYFIGEIISNHFFNVELTSDTCGNILRNGGDCDEFWSRGIYCTSTIKLHAGAT